MDEVTSVDVIQSSRLKGRGTFSADGPECTVDFELVHHAIETVVSVGVPPGGPRLPFNPISDSGTLWKLRGTLSDNRPIACDRLHVRKSRLVSSGEQSATLIPFDPVIIGEQGSGHVESARFPLVGMFSGTFEARDGRWSISVSEASAADECAAEASRLHRLPLEGLTLEIRNPDAPKAEYEEVLLCLLTLLSLARGTGVTCNRQIFFFAGSENPCEVWCRQVDHEHGPGSCVPEHALGTFIERTLPEWRRWPPDKREEARIATTCINLSATGYLDMRLFMIAQGWELLANSWAGKPEISDEEADLKKQLKTAYNTWREPAGCRDRNGVLWGRINFAFEWTRLVAQLRSLADSRRLALQKIGLDFVALKEARDNAAHRCALPEMLKSNKRSAIDLLIAAQRGLQYLLLNELGYTGDIDAEHDGWRVVARMSDMFLPLSEG